MDKALHDGALYDGVFKMQSLLLVAAAEIELTDDRIEIAEEEN
jgi:hypothetical protein